MSPMPKSAKLGVAVRINTAPPTTSARRLFRLNVIDCLLPVRLESGIDAMFRVRRNQNVSPDINAGAGAFFEGDDGQAIEEVVQYLLALYGRSLGDAVADLG